MWWWVVAGELLFLRRWFPNMFQVVHVPKPRNSTTRLFYHFVNKAFLGFFRRKRRGDEKQNHTNLNINTQIFRYVLHKYFRSDVLLRDFNPLCLITFCHIEILGFTWCKLYLLRVILDLLPCLTPLFQYSLVPTAHCLFVLIIKHCSILTGRDKGTSHCRSQNALDGVVRCAFIEQYWFCCSTFFRRIIIQRWSFIGATYNLRNVSWKF